MIVICVFVSLVISKAYSFKQRMIIIIASLPVGWCLWATDSRGAWLGFAVALLFLAMLKSRKLFILILILLLASPLFMPDSIKNRFSDFSTIGERGGTVWERIKLWSGTINMIKEHPFLGVGVNTYTKNFPKYKPKDYPDVRYTHNSYLHMAAEVGVVGAGLFLAFLICLIASAAKAIKRSVEGVDKDLFAGLLAGIIGFLIHCVVDTHLYSVTLSVLLFACLGVAVSFRNISYEKRA